MKVFVDGMIFGRQRRGGISRMWEEYLDRLPDLGVDLQLLIPWNSRNDSLQRVLANRKKFTSIQTDLFSWPRRWFEQAGVRSFRLEHLHLERRAQVFHSTYYSTVTQRQVKKVVTVHDLILELFPGEFPDRFASLEREAMRKTIKNADAIVAVSQNSKSDILTVYPFIPEERITVIRHGVPLADGVAEDNFSELALRWQLPVGAGEYLLFVGNRGSYKNFELLVQLLSRHRESSAFVVCVGGDTPGPDRKRLERLGVADRCVFIDSIPDNALRILYRNARALVFPSRYEGFGLPLLEAMANDCPVICSDIAVFHEIGGDAAIYFTPTQADSLAEGVAALDKADRAAMVRRGRLNVQRFSWDDSAKKLAALYQAL